MDEELDAARREVLGQIAILRARLDRLERLLVNDPVGEVMERHQVLDAIGNLSFQTGMMIGIATKFQGMVFSP